MKLVHASIPADDPKTAAEVLADIMGGEALPFPPAGADAFMAWSKDGAIELEIVPRGRTLHFDDEQGNWRPSSVSSRLSEVHLAIAVAKSAEEVLAIAQAAGWPARRCDRGNGLFQLVEVWVDGCFMIEFMDPGQARRYEEVVTPASWKAYLAQAALR
ncbi:hypothetical protein A1351_07545 [Methylosinus sp. R-45379]|jgi:hypothetical protein|uniref:hypothetical protein n=1 Tax=unclassified Methylosinus TaxID=2624500 RepID=UPI0004666870|nr:MULTISPECIES: hypothetical protein [unclassified Methylosinus]OAI30677.1 hypothetical protein A1351_07545 [Methylosinus sp. R-45379]TDX67224.1 hypothetical protein EDE12_101767 [Methylosinus sp. sav-2]